jgi:hypothetical protein
MTKQEAVEAIEAGEKVSHRFFTDEEYITKGKDGCYVFENGYEFLPFVFWSDRNTEEWGDGWAIFQEK